MALWAKATASHKLKAATIALLNGSLFAKVSVLYAKD